MEKISQKEFHSIKRLSKNYIGLTAEKTINVVSCNTGKEVFVSDKLSNMSQSIYNQETGEIDKELVYPDFIAFLNDLSELLGIGE